MLERERQMVVVERSEDGTPTVWCDPEIVDLVAALNSANVRTVASCSGHGHRPGFISLKDGRTLIVCESLDQARESDHVWPDINGDTAHMRVRAASGGDVAIKTDRSFTPNLEEPASLEQRAQDILAAEYERNGFHGAATDARSPEPSPHCRVTLDAITAALANQQGVGGWRPTETYRGGVGPLNSVLLFWPQHGGKVNEGYFDIDEEFDCHPVGWTAQESGWRGMADQCIPREQPTHWRPLPERPAAPEGSN